MFITNRAELITDIFPKLRLEWIIKAGANYAYVRLTGFRFGILWLVLVPRGSASGSRCLSRTFHDYN